MTKKLALAGLGLLAALWTTHTIAGCVGDEPNLTPPDAGGDGTATPPPPPPGGKANGAPCAAGGECSSGQCADGVCCDSACNGVCEKCNLPGKVGQCEPIPDGEDPDNECPTTPLPDAGVNVPDSSASDAATDADPDAQSDAQVEAGPPPLNVPDGGLTLNDTQCAGKCNGKRACAYPDRTKTCGTQFCNNTTQQGRAACDGKGHCLLELEACQAYSCPIDPDGGASAGPGCNKTCTGPADCLNTHYCDTSGVCKPKLANGATCASPVQCQSGHCYGAPTGVCCNDECNVTGGTCTETGKVGQCTCPACATGACKLWYRDEDGDGYGDMNATVQNGRAIPGCEKGPDGGAPTPPAAGYVENNTDCFDNATAVAAQVHPGQTGWFTSPYGPNNSFDYDCSGTVEKETPEYIGATCGFCYGSGFVLCGHYDTCSDANQGASLTCGLTSGNCGFLCFGCRETGDNAFTSNVPCGTSARKTICGSCTAKGGGVTGTTYPIATQRCH